MSSDFLTPIKPTAPLMPTKSMGISKSVASDKAKLEKAAKEFESVFMDIVVKSMRDTVETSDVTGETEKVKLFQGMLDSEYSKISANKNKLGIAQMIIKQMTPKEPSAEVLLKMEALKK
ncbi:MAG: rod-binding protein [Deltaproteobacteria bacterium]|nr:rod-binding protein [Deltaproteobacteria bacterium]